MTADLGEARGVDAEAFGEPGQRTFRLRVDGDDHETASLWLEKDHVQALAGALMQVLAQLKYAGGPEAKALADFPETPHHDFRVGRMNIGYDRSRNAVVIQVGQWDREDGYDLRFALTLDRCAYLARQLERIIVGGRPLCPLCGLPEPGHVCIRSNGHLAQPVPEEREGEEEET